MFPLPAGERSADTVHRHRSRRIWNIEMDIRAVASDTGDAVPGRHRGAVRAWREMIGGDGFGRLRRKLLQPLQR